MAGGPKERTAPAVHLLKVPEGQDVEDMENHRNSEIARMPGEAREVFLSRMLLLVVEYLDAEGAGGSLDPVLHALEDDRSKGVRKGRKRPGGYV